jgi:hypothetical protein
MLPIAQGEAAYLPRASPGGGRSTTSSPDVLGAVVLGEPGSIQRRIPPSAYTRVPEPATPLPWARLHRAAALFFRVFLALLRLAVGSCQRLAE